jgi:sterol desaturase/sphingolipid hydroxylase (fatty acid hydroxylase superfamily)
VLLKIAAGDVLRYWLHRWSHEHGVLWRLHAVHHQPRKLYAANVFRFHPLDKALQFLGDTLPFILLGVGPETLAYYFVVYATGGFFQHSNLDVRYGWLNYLVVGPELHRWHHARRIAESNANYAHTFALWDLLFGTYRRPADRQVGELGLLDDHYPSDFLRQLWAPARRPTP